MDRTEKIDKWSAVADKVARLETAIRCPFCDQADLVVQGRGEFASSFWIKCPACNESNSVLFSRPLNR